MPAITPPMLIRSRSIARALIPARMRRAVVGSRFMQARHAAALARGSKRLDLCAAQVANVLHLAGGPGRNLVRDRVCAEVGSGWVLSHALVLHLLGARKVFATDLNPIARPGLLRDAVRLAEPSIVRDILAPFDNYRAIRDRLENLRSIDRFDFAALRRLGIEYRAPVDLSVTPFQDPVDFWFSHSVLEHVPRASVPGLISNLNESLAPGGAMIHSIHLEDHRDIALAPFRFLELPAASYPESEQVSRGNRVRASGWLHAFSSLDDLEVSSIFEWTRDTDVRPRVVDDSIEHAGEADLVTSHIGILALKRGGAVRTANDASGRACPPGET